MCFMYTASKSYSEYTQTFPSDIPTTATTFPTFQKGSQNALFELFRSQQSPQTQNTTQAKFQAMQNDIIPLLSSVELNYFT